MNGQNQYDPALPLTSLPTDRPVVSLIHPDRSRPGVPAIGPASLLAGGSLGVAALLAAVVLGGVSGIAANTLAGGAWLSIVLGLLLPGRHEREGLELSRRLGVFRHEVTSLGDEPSRAGLERVLALARELKLPDEEIADDVARIRASLDALTLRDVLRSGAWPVTASPDPLITGDVCHFVCPVRFGRRRADQYGHLVLTRHCLRFRGALDVSVAWSEVAAVERADRELIVSLQASRRMFRFSCHTFDEAARGGVIAIELARLAAAAPAGSPLPYQAT